MIIRSSHNSMRSHLSQFACDSVFSIECIYIEKELFLTLVAEVKEVKESG